MATPPPSALARHSTLYRWLLWLYPAAFRREYEQDMVQLFSDRLRDEARRRRRAAAARVWFHTLRDLVRSVPKQRIEALMSVRQTTPKLVIAAISSAAIVAMIVADLLAVVLLLAAASGVLAYRQLRGQNVHVSAGPRPRRWILNGTGLLAVGLFAPPFLVGDDINSLEWSLIALLLIAGFVAIATGLVKAMSDSPRAH